MSSVTVPRLFTVVEAAEFLGMSRNAVYIACREGRIPHFKVNDWSVRFDLDELKAWLASNRRGPKVDAPLAPPKRRRARLPTGPQEPPPPPTRQPPA